MSLEWVNLADATARQKYRRITTKKCIQCCTSDEERGIDRSRHWHEFLPKMAKGHYYSVRACWTMFLKLPVRFSSLLWAEVTCPQEQQGYSSTVENRLFFFNNWLRLSFRLWQGSHRRKHTEPTQSCPSSCPNQALVSQWCRSVLPENEVIAVITFNGCHPLYKRPIGWSLCWDPNAGIAQNWIQARNWKPQEH